MGHARLLLDCDENSATPPRSVCQMAAVAFLRASPRGFLGSVSSTSTLRARGSRRPLAKAQGSVEAALGMPSDWTKVQ